MSSGVFYSYLRNLSECQDIARVFYAKGNKRSSGIVPSTPIWQLVLILLLMAVFNGLVATVFNYIRKNIFQDKDNLDIDFNAGGKVSVGLTATTIVTQRTWFSALLFAPTSFSSRGISGPFGFAASGAVSIVLFAILSVQFKIRAPGAKTFLQVIRARFGRPTHIVFIIFALACNLVVLAVLMINAGFLLKAHVPGLSVELATGMMAIVIGVYPLIGGLGATFYVSYFNTTITFAIILIFMRKLLHDPNLSPISNVEDMYHLINCSKGPKGNLDESLLTMVSMNGLQAAIVGIASSITILTLDQSYWQSTVSAKPLQGVWGYISAGLVYFATPFVFGTTMGGAYTVLSAQQGEALLSNVYSGLQPAIVAQKSMGAAGELMLLVAVLMAVTSTGAAEVIAISSIVVYDIYQPYIKPFRKVDDINTCVLCGRPRGHKKTTPVNRCRCMSMKTCQICKVDNKANDQGSNFKPEYRCILHGPYREYTDYLITIKNWSLLWTTLAIIPLVLILSLGNVSRIYSLYSTTAVSAAIPVILSLFWARLNAAGMIAGTFGGLVIGWTAGLVTASQQTGDVMTFFFAPGQFESNTAGRVAAVLGAGIITIVVTLVTNRNFTEAQAHETWEKTRDVDNPLSPWAELYAKELKLPGSSELDNRPSLEEVTIACRGARISAFLGSTVIALIIYIIWPAAMRAAGVFDQSTFTNWMNMVQAWAIITAIFIIVFPIVSEVIDIRAASKEQKSISIFGKLPVPVFHPSHRRNLGAKEMMSMIGSKQLMNPVVSTDVDKKTRL